MTKTVRVEDSEFEVHERLQVIRCDEIDKYGNMEHYNPSFANEDGTPIDRLGGITISAELADQIHTSLGVDVRDESGINIVELDADNVEVL